MGNGGCVERFSLTPEGQPEGHHAQTRFPDKPARLPDAPGLIDKNEISSPRAPKHKASSSTPRTSNLEPSTLNTMAAQRAAVKTTFAVSRTLQPIYSGGSLALSEDGRVLAASLGEDVLLTNLANGKELGRVESVCRRLLAPLPAEC